jgi:hypothetical protein
VPHLGVVRRQAFGEADGRGSVFTCRGATAWPLPATQPSSKAEQIAILHRLKIRNREAFRPGSTMGGKRPLFYALTAVAGDAFPGSPRPALPRRVAFYLWGESLCRSSLSVSRISSVADSLLVCRHCRTSCLVKVTPALFSDWFLLPAVLDLLPCAAAGSWFWV